VSSAALRFCLSRLATEPDRATVVDVVPLPGGLDALTHRITIRIGQEQHAVVMRRLHRAAHAQRAAEELAALRALPKLAWPILPQLLAADPYAEHSELPTFVTSLVPGAARLGTAGLELRLSQLAEALHTLHTSLPTSAAGIPALQRVAQHTDTTLHHLPSLDVLRCAVATLPERTGTERMIHADYHIGNTLYEGNTLRGVVDWGTARVGPTEYDVAYCHMDLCLVFGEDAAATFLEHYQALAGARVSELPRWTLSAASRAYPDPAAWLPSWHAWGRTDLTAELVRARLDGLVRSALATV
jgi:aminoglycoside phosphotransferase (APT) family kinase protein